MRLMLALLTAPSRKLAMAFPLPEEQVGQLPFHQDWSQEELQRRLAEQIPDLVPGVRKRIVEAAALTAYHAESGHRRPLVCDGARHFKVVADVLALCRVHAGRPYQSL